jgi:hypothetical protein
MWKSQRLDGGCTYISGIELTQEVNYVKVGRGINWWFGDWTHVFTWCISRVKVVWIKPLQPKPDTIINATIYHMFYVQDIFPGVHFNNNYGIYNK